jgi:hypothetical protein
MGRRPIVKAAWFIAAGLLVGSVVACGAPPSIPGLGDEGECFFSATATVWEDTNGNKALDPDEPFLANIPVNTYHTGQAAPIREGVTNSDGNSSFGAISHACDWENYYVRVEVPSGYTASTPTQAPFDAFGDGGTGFFGLVPDLPATPTSTPTPEALGECFFSASADGWEDVNADGVRDPGELPLANITLIMTYRGASEPFDESRTSEMGTAEFGAISQTCDWENYRIVVEVPAGYAASTATEFTFAEVGNGGSVAFGLVPDAAP